MNSNGHLFPRSQRRNGGKSKCTESDEIDGPHTLLKLPGGSDLRPPPPRSTTTRGRRDPPRAAATSRVPPPQKTGSFFFLFRFCFNLLILFPGPTAGFDPLDLDATRAVTIVLTWNAPPANRRRPYAPAVAGRPPPPLPSIQLARGAENPPQRKWARNVLGVSGGPQAIRSFSPAASPSLSDPSFGSADIASPTPLLASVPFAVAAGPSLGKHWLRGAVELFFFCPFL
ncbi:hypothetical protein NL676_013220 [Syzygium grande]|nr:hypothetical protein NL676_013220 [Syzygium grande]